MSAPIATPWLSSQSDQDPRSATGKRLRWGVIATGGIARSVSQDLALLPDAELHAVSSRSQGTAESFAATYGFAKAYGDDDGVPGYQRLLADGSVDVVYVATPHAQHHEIVLAALNAGKHVLCEKDVHHQCPGSERARRRRPGAEAVPHGGRVEPFPPGHAARRSRSRLPASWVMCTG